MATSQSFGDIEIRPAQRQVLVGGAPTPLGARAFDLLIALITHRDRVVSKNELLDSVWPGLVVEEGNLHTQISALRKALGSTAIVTVPGRGYQFVAQPNEDSDPQPGTETDSGSPTDPSTAEAFQHSWRSATALTSYP